MSFEELLQTSDVVSVHCPLNASTNKMFNRETFKKMKKNAIFVTSARGEVHDETALHEALVNKEIWGAGLDVTDPEPMRKDNPLLFMENVIVTPHIGSAEEG